MKHHQKNNYLGIFLLVFILFSIYGFDYLISHMQTITGKGSVGTVDLTVLPSPIIPQPTPQAQGGASLGGSLAFFVLRTETNERISVLSLETKEYKPLSTKITLKNYGDTYLSLSASSTLSILSLPEPHIFLAPGEETLLQIDVLPSPVGIYTGFLTIVSDVVTKKIPVIIHVTSAKKTFTVSLVIPPTFTTVPFAGQLFAQISLASISGEKATVTYMIQDMQNQILYQEQEELVLRSLSFDKTLQLPTYLKEGDYAFITLVKAQGSRSSAVAHFSIRQEVQPRSETPQTLSQTKNNMLVFAIIALVLVTMISLFLREKR